MRNAAFFLKYKLHHILGWMIVFGSWFFLREEEYARNSDAFIITAIKVADLALMIYITNYFLIPRLLYRKKYALFALSFILLVVASSFLKMFLLGDVLGYTRLYNWSDNLRKNFYDNVVPHFFLGLAGAAFKLMLDYGRLQQRMAETAREKAEAELNFLKSQINPHFVFNSLNAVYFLIHKDNPEARAALHKFSEMLRYQLYEMNGEQVPIEKEVHYLKDYMDFQQLRQDDNFSVRFDCDSKVQGFSIEPLLLIPLVENAFKHISHYNDRPNFVELKMERNNGQFSFGIRNSKEPDHVKMLHGGIGLANVRRRLELLYPDKHNFTIVENPDEFIVNLNLRLS